MRKVTAQAAGYFINDTPAKLGNTRIEIKDGTTKMYLFGNLIATKKDGKIQITNAGWFSNTTRERLNGIPGVLIHQHKWQWFLNGEPWDGKLTDVK